MEDPWTCLYTWRKASESHRAVSLSPARSSVGLTLPLICSSNPGWSIYPINALCVTRFPILSDSIPVSFFLPESRRTLRFPLETMFACPAVLRHNKQPPATLFCSSSQSRSLSATLANCASKQKEHDSTIMRRPMARHFLSDELLLKVLFSIATPTVFNGSCCVQHFVVALVS